MLPRPLVRQLCPGSPTFTVDRGCGRAWRLLPLAAALAAIGAPVQAQWGKPLPGSAYAAERAAAAAAAAAPVAPVAASGPGIALKTSPVLEPPPRGEAGKKLPITLQAQTVRGRPDLDMVAEGDAVLKRGDLKLSADLLSYDQVQDLALARGNVVIVQEGNRYTGPELQLKVQRFEGFFLNPTYYFGRTAAGGKAERIDFIDSQRTVATKATYSSCPADGSNDPDWLLSSDSVRMDFDNNEGIAEGGVLRFLGVPILAAPRLSFPLTDERKSGWLPPSFAIDNRSGVLLAMPWYWNIAPNRDATFTPSASVRRGFGLGSEFRYLEPSFRGELTANVMPYDRDAERSRYSLGAQHLYTGADELRAKLQIQRVSDNNYWKDFQRDLPSLTPRLLLSNLQVTRPFGAWSTYFNAQSWQVLQNAGSQFETPYQRLPQIGARTVQPFGDGFEVGFEGEFNRFANPGNTLDRDRPDGIRLHAIASISRPWVTPGWTLTPKVSLNAASYSLDRPRSDGPTNTSRVIPTFSIDSAWVLERESSWFGTAFLQTLEPRLLYVNTPYRKQSNLPNFDSASYDFNFESIFTENAFSGVDRVSDSHEMTAGSRRA